MGRPKLERVKRVRLFSPTHPLLSEVRDGRDCTARLRVKYKIEDRLGLGHKKTGTL